MLRGAVEGEGTPCACLCAGEGLFSPPCFPRNRTSRVLRGAGCCSERIPSLFTSLRVPPAPCVFQHSIAAFYQRTGPLPLVCQPTVAASHFPPAAAFSCLEFASKMHQVYYCWLVFFFFSVNLQMDTRCSQFLLKLCRLGRAACGSRGNNRDRVEKKNNPCLCFWVEFTASRSGIKSQHSELQKILKKQKIFLSFHPVL